MAKSTILEKNLEKMLGTNLVNSEFHDFLITESVGGNTGTYFDEETGKEHLCVAGNCQVTGLGEILEFTNSINCEENYSVGFRVVLDRNYKSGYSRIIDCYSHSCEKLPKQLTTIIAGTVMGYNYRMRKAKNE